MIFTLIKLNITLLKQKRQIVMILNFQLYQLTIMTAAARSERVNSTCATERP